MTNRCTVTAGAAWAVAVLSIIACSSRAPPSPGELEAMPGASPAPAAQAQVPQEPPATPPAVPSGSSVRYLVDGESVGREAYERFRSSISEVPGTWYCDETMDGGETGWDAVDAQGKVYEVRELTERDSSTSSITPK